VSADPSCGCRSSAAQQLRSEHEPAQRQSKVQEEISDQKLLSAVWVDGVWKESSGATALRCFLATLASLVSARALLSAVARKAHLCSVDSGKVGMQGCLAVNSSSVRCSELNINQVHGVSVVFG